MANKYCVAWSDSEYKESIRLLRSGFTTSKGRKVRPNPRIATIVQLQAALGLRVGDVLDLKLSSFIRDGDRFKLNIREQKTDKIRRFTVPDPVYMFIQDYALQNGIGVDSKLFHISERQIERHLNLVINKMGLNVKNYGTHSYRKYFSQKIYDSTKNILVVQELLQHSSPTITRRYLGVSEDDIEKSLALTSEFLIKD